MNRLSLNWVYYHQDKLIITRWNHQLLSAYLSVSQLGQNSPGITVCSSTQRFPLSALNHSSPASLLFPCPTLQIDFTSAWFYNQKFVLSSSNIGLVWAREVNGRQLVSECVIHVSNLILSTINIHLVYLSIYALSSFHVPRGSNRI